METAHAESEVVSLMDICLRSISRHLPRFISAFSTTQDTELRRNIRLLQRLHSAYLIEKQLDDEGQLDEAYWNFLINEYLEELNVGICAAGNLDALQARIAEVGHVLKEIKFDPVPGPFLNVSISNGYDYDPEDFPEHLTFEVDFVNKLLRHLPNAKILMLSSYCNDETLEIVSKSCPELKELYFHTHRVTDNGLKSLCCQDKRDGAEVKGLSLEVISLSYEEQVKDGIAFLLQNMPSLEIVDCAHLPGLLYRMHKHGVSSISQSKYNLTRLDFSGCDRKELSDLTGMLTLLTDICPRTKELAVRISTQEQLEIISTLSELQDLTIKGAKSDALGHPALDFDSFLKSRGGMARSLEVDYFKLSAGILAQYCPNLEALTLRRAYFGKLQSTSTIKSMTALRAILLEDMVFDVDPNLRNVSLWHGSLDDALIQQSIMHILNSSSNLELLSFCECNIRNCEEFHAELSKFCKSKALQHLEFVRCDIEMALLKSVISNSYNLKTLVVEDCVHINPCRLDELEEVAHPQQQINIK